MPRNRIPSLGNGTVLIAGGVAGGLSACGGGSGGGSSPPPMPVASGEALDTAITADPPSTAPNLLNADGSGTPAEDAMLEETADAARAKIDGWADTVYERTNESDSTDTFVVYNNIEAPKDTPFSDVYPFDNDADSDMVNDSLIVDTNNVERITSVAELPECGYTDERCSTRMTKLSPARLPTWQGHTRAFPGAVSTGESDGSFVAIGGNWYFTPDNDDRSGACTGLRLRPFRLLDE